MSKLLTLGEAVDATAVAAQTGVATDEAPFARGFNAIAHVVLTGVTGSPVIVVQTSPDDSTYTTVATINAITNAHVMEEITLDAYVRLNVTTGGSAGTVAAYITE